MHVKHTPAPTCKGLRKTAASYHIKQNRRRLCLRQLPSAVRRLPRPIPCFSTGSKARQEEGAGIPVLHSSIFPVHHHVHLPTLLISPNFWHRDACSQAGTVSHGLAGLRCWSHQSSEWVLDTQCRIAAVAFKHIRSVWAHHTLRAKVGLIIYFGTYY